VREGGREGRREEKAEEEEEGEEGGRAARRGGKTHLDQKSIWGWLGWVEACGAAAAAAVEEPCCWSCEERG